MKLQPSWTILSADGPHYQRLIDYSSRGKSPIHAHIISLNEIKARHNTSSIPPKSKRKANQHGQVEDRNASDREEENLGLGKKRKRTVSQMCYVPVPAQSTSIHGIGHKKWQKAFPKGDWQSEELKTICGQIKNILSFAFNRNTHQLSSLQ
jgi:hypothetical protein